MKKVIRLSESQLIKTIKKIIKESEITELHASDFKVIEDVDCVEPKGDLRVGIAEITKEDSPKLGTEYLVVYYYDEKEERDVIYAHGLEISDYIYDKKDDEGNPIICRIAERLLSEFSEEYKMYK